MSRDSQRRFEFSRMNSFLSWAFSKQDKKRKINRIINESVTIKQAESYLNYGDCVSFLYWFFSYCSQLSKLFFKKVILKLHNKTLFNLTNVFDFIGWSKATIYVDDFIWTISSSFNIKCRVWKKLQEIYILGLLQQNKFFIFPKGCNQSWVVLLIPLRIFVNHITIFSSSPTQHLRWSSLWQKIRNSSKLFLTIVTESFVLSVTGLLDPTLKQRQISIKTIKYSVQHLHVQT